MQVRELIIALLEECCSIEDEVEILWLDNLRGEQTYIPAIIMREDIKQTDEGENCVVIKI